MGPLRGKGSGRDVAVVGVITVALLALILNRALGAPVDSGSPNPVRAFASHRFGFSGSLPAGWHRSARQLVPLLMPKEVLSVGTGPMPAGGGGNCGREPVAAIGRMRAGDVLISIQEYAVTRRMRPLSAETFPPPRAYARPARLELRRRERDFAGTRVPRSRALWSATLPFRARGRAFDALVYVRGKPSPRRLGQVVAILAGLRFRAGDH